MLQFAECLPDRPAADAVGSHIDWNVLASAAPEWPHGQADPAWGVRSVLWSF